MSGHGYEHGRLDRLLLGIEIDGAQGTPCRAWWGARRQHSVRPRVPRAWPDPHRSDSRTSTDERHGVPERQANPMRRAAEQRHVTGLSRIGIHNVSSTAREDYEKARAMASTIPSRGLWRGAIACLIAVRRA